MCASASDCTDERTANKERTSTRVGLSLPSFQMLTTLSSAAGFKRRKRLLRALMQAAAYLRLPRGGEGPCRCSLCSRPRCARSSCLRTTGRETTQLLGRPNASSERKQRPRHSRTSMPLTAFLAAARLMAAATTGGENAFQIWPPGKQSRTLQIARQAGLYATVLISLIALLAGKPKKCEVTLHRRLYITTCCKQCIWK
jgi:hypothetical protein